MSKRCVAILALVATGLIGVGIAGCETGPHVDKQIRDALSPACGKQGVEQAAAYTEGPGPHPIVLLDASGGRHSWTDKVPIEWWPASVDATELVACVGAEETFVEEVCQYFGPGGVSRYRYMLRIWLVEARTGKTLADSRLSGSVPPECPGAIKSGQYGLLEGSHVSFDQARAWLEPHVLAGRQQE